MKHCNYIPRAIICALLAVTAPMVTLAQSAGTTVNQQKESVEGDRLFNSGLKAYTQGKIKEAAQLWEQARSIYARELGEDHPDTLDSMNNLAFAYGDLGQYDKALVLQENILELRRMKLGENHSGTLISMNNLAITYSDLGQHDKALVLKEKTLELMRTKFGEDHPNTLSSINNLAVTYIHLGQYDKALVLQENVFKLRSSKLDEDHPDTLNSMNNLAVTYSYLGQLDKALLLKEKTLELRIAKLGKDHPDTLISMNNLANIYRDLGQYDKELVLQEKTLELRRTKLGEGHPDTIGSMHNLAVTYRDLGQHDKALVLQEKTLELMRAKLGEDHPNTLSSMSNLANTYGDLGQYDKALALQEKTLELRRANLGEDHPDTIGSMNNLAVTYSDLGQHDKALVLKEKTLELMHAKLGEDHPNTLSSMSNLANTYGDLGQYDKALALQEKTLELGYAKLGENHPNTLHSMHNLAITYRHLDKNDKALALVPMIIKGAEKLRTQSGLNMEQRQSIFAKYTDKYQRYAEWYADAKRIEDSFNIGDLSKARTLTDNIKYQSALRSLPTNEQIRLQTSESEGRVLQIRLEKLQNTPAGSATSPTTSVVLALQKEIETHNIKHAQLLSELQAAYPKYAQLTTITAATAADASQLLGKKEAFISYLVDTKGNAQAFVLTQNGKAQWVDLGKMSNLSQTVATYRKLVAPNAKNPIRSATRGRLVMSRDGSYQWLLPQEGTPKEESVITTEPKKALELLQTYWYEKLINPILPFADAHSHWIISPDKDLALLPFDILPEKSTTTHTPLIQNRQITLVQSFSVYALLKRREAEYAKLPREKTLFAMGNPFYRTGWETERGMTRGQGESGFVIEDCEAIWGRKTDKGIPKDMGVGAEQVCLSALTWKNLPGSGYEMKSVSKLFSADGKIVHAYEGKDASEDKLLQLNQAGELKDYRYLLFSAHGYLARNPSLSSIVLSQEKKSTTTDGYVTASEWPLYDLKSDLTVLSACDTGVGKTQIGESIMGLPYALFVAGNKNTLLTLWPVHDEATAKFMQIFFAKLKSGIAQAEALNQTKKEFMRDVRWNNPTYWAAFVLYGV